jgi:FkbM family methyltransferase
VNMRVLGHEEVQNIINQKMELDGLLKFSGKSKSQFLQDVFVLSELGFKRNGYFVEFGATNGVDLSNTHLLENVFGWNGILAEPSKNWHESLMQNRQCHIEKSCVWSKSNETLVFNQARDAAYSTIDTFSQSDMHTQIRQDGERYEVQTISLMDLLNKYNAPQTIDYLSIDTEGSELEILSHFDFSKYRFRVITCEHNFTPAREAIFNLLSPHGYLRKHPALSFCDDWYVLPGT